jgi:hypothetical protein
MLIFRKSFYFFLLACGAIFLSGMTSTAAAQGRADKPEWDSNPCEIDFSSIATLPETGALLGGDHNDSGALKTSGLMPANFGAIVYDRNQGVCWLADANLAGNPIVRKLLGVAGVSPDGLMDYPTALKFVDALNHFDHGRGFLGRNNWQLPVNPPDDPSCSSVNHGNFGASCTGSALGNLYNVGLRIAFPDSVVHHFGNRVWPFRNLQPGYYWTQDSDSGGEVTMSFLNSVRAANTVKYNYMHVLPMTTVPIGAPPFCPPSFTGVVPYTSGPAAGKAVYDCNTQVTWTLDANLAATENFGVTGSTTIIPDVITSAVVTVPLIDADGAMLYATASDPGSGWLDGLNDSNYAGTNHWTIPHLIDLQTLFQDLNLQPNDDARLVAKGHVEPFWNFQPFFYWACVRDQKGDSQSPCNGDLAFSPPGTSFAYSFNFDDGFEGTSLTDKQFYVMVYFPAPRHSH